jgi:hypothetical protein
MEADEFTEQFPGCNRRESRYGCPHQCGVGCQQNAARQLASGKRIAERMKNLTRDDLQWLAGTGNYGQ